MRFELISDNTDTLVGMRLAGIKGIMAKKADEAERALKEAVEKQDVAVVLITEPLAKLCAELIHSLKSTHKTPLIIEIPDGRSQGSKKDSITRYIREAIGLKI